MVVSIFSFASIKNGILHVMVEITTATRFLRNNSCYGCIIFTDASIQNDFRPRAVIKMKIGGAVGCSLLLAEQLIRNKRKIIKIREAVGCSLLRWKQLMHNKCKNRIPDKNTYIAFASIPRHS